MFKGYTYLARADTVRKRRGRQLATREAGDHATKADGCALYLQQVSVEIGSLHWSFLPPAGASPARGRRHIDPGTSRQGA